MTLFTGRPWEALEHPPRILIVKTSALGDVVHAVPAFEALAEALPDAIFGWVVEEPFEPIVAGHPRLERVIPVRLRRWRKRPLAGSTRAQTRGSLRELRAFGADVALDLMGNHKAGALAALSGARWRVGARRTDRREPSSVVWINRPVPVTGDHEVDRLGSLLAAFGMDSPRLGYRPGALGGSAPPGSPPLAEPYFLIQPGAGWGNKQYPPERWGAIGAELSTKHGVDVGVLAGPGEEALARRVVEASEGRVVLVAPGGVGGLIEILRRAGLVLGGDTGPLHLAHALGRPVLAVHGPTDPARHGPWRAPERALWKKLPCSYCYRRFDETKACLFEVPSDRVVARASEIFAASRHHDSEPSSAAIDRPEGPS